MFLDRNKRGKMAEALAVKYLQSNGLKLVRRNFSCRNGEIDIIMRDKDYLVFIEVRFRNTLTHSHPLETIDYRKQQKILKTVQFYLLQYPEYGHHPCRIDAVAIYSGRENTGVEKQVEWVQNAIQLT